MLPQKRLVVVTSITSPQSTPCENDEKARREKALFICLSSVIIDGLFLCQTTCVASGIVNGGHTAVQICILTMLNVPSIASPLMCERTEVIRQDE